MQEKDVELYRRFLNGDDKGLESLFSLYQHPLLQFIYGYVRDIGMAEELLIDVFFTLYNKPYFQKIDGASLKTYIFTIARHKSLNALKKRARRKEISLESIAEQGEISLECNFSSPDDAILSHECNQTLYNALSSLKKEHREVLYLRFFQNLPPEKIAKITHKNVKQVYNLLTRSKTALKEKLRLKNFS